MLLHGYVCNVAIYAAVWYLCCCTIIYVSCMGIQICKLHNQVMHLQEHGEQQLNKACFVLSMGHKSCFDLCMCTKLLTDDVYWHELVRHLISLACTLLLAQPPIPPIRTP